MKYKFLFLKSSWTVNWKGKICILRSHAYQLFKKQLPRRDGFLRESLLISKRIICMGESLAPGWTSGVASSISRLSRPLPEVHWYPHPMPSLWPIVFHSMQEQSRPWHHFLLFPRWVTCVLRSAVMYLLPVSSRMWKPEWKTQNIWWTQQCNYLYDQSLGNESLKNVTQHPEHSILTTETLSILLMLLPSLRLWLSSTVNSFWWTEFSWSKDG